ncbi:MAG: hypothetical protein WBB27_13040 [Maribacter sp.]
MKIYSTLFALVSLCTVYAQTDIEKTKETVSKSTIEGHIYFLADDFLKGRATGTLKTTSCPRTQNYLYHLNHN